ncbi:conserved hypothetical protein [Xenorhabdus cabanillasii JM26]|uniref:Antitoxin n=1 Tax=Xenorhabdus cabanillasii JM26 TaxID=1427517 RepID=W1IMF3_9GAMM|nr:conserved hypothetical protein [Xenorhabdus cabanillasii JM26]
MHETKTDLSQLADRAVDGEVVIIAKAGKPYVQLVPISQLDRNPGGFENEKTPLFERGFRMLVGERGFEPPTHWSQTSCATKLRYSPKTKRILLPASRIVNIFLKISGYLMIFHPKFTHCNIFRQRKAPL